MNASIKSAAFAVFNDADNTSAKLADRLFALGIADKATARPLAMEWASKKYNVALKESNKGGMTFVERNTDAERAMYRVLSVCFPSVDLAKAATGRASSKSAVEKLLAAYEKLSPAEKRTFKAALAK